MYNIGVGSSFPDLEIVCFFAVSQAGCGILTLMIWQLMMSSYGIHPFGRLGQALPLLLVELSQRLKLRYWLAKISRLALNTKSRHKFPLVFFSPEFLLCRDGPNIFDFFKTLSLNDVSPPVCA